MQLFHQLTTEVQKKKPVIIMHMLVVWWASCISIAAKAYPIGHKPAGLLTNRLIIFTYFDNFIDLPPNTKSSESLSKQPKRQHQSDERMERPPFPTPPCFIRL